MGKHRLKVFFDGGCRPNPGRIEVAVVVRRVAHVFDDLGHGNNDDAEWLALIKALEVAQTLGEPEFELIRDAATVSNQANRVGECRGAASQAHLARFTALAAAARPARIRWIGRAQNLAESSWRRSMIDSCRDWRCWCGNADCTRYRQRKFRQFR